MIIHLPERVYEAIKDDPKIVELNNINTSFYESENFCIDAKDAAAKAAEWLAFFAYMLRCARLLKDKPVLYRQFMITMKSEDLKYLNKVLLSETETENKLNILYHLDNVNGSKQDYTRQYIAIYEAAPDKTVFSPIIHIAYFAFKARQVINNYNDVKTAKSEIQKLRYEIESTSQNEKLSKMLCRKYLAKLEKLFEKTFDYRNPEKTYENMDLLINDCYDWSLWCKSDYEDIKTGDYSKMKMLFRAFIFAADNRDADRAAHYLKQLIQAINTALDKKHLALKGFITFNKDYRYKFAVLGNAIYHILKSIDCEQMLMTDKLLEHEKRYLIGLLSNQALSKTIKRDFDHGDRCSFSFLESYEKQMRRLVLSFLTSAAFVDEVKRRIMNT